MDFFLFNLFATILWVNVLGHFYHVFASAFSFIFFPILFIYNPFTLKCNISEYLYISLCYLLLLLNDFLLISQNDGGDFVGRGLNTLSLYSTVCTCSVSLFFVAAKIVIERDKIEGIISIPYYTILKLCGFIITMACITIITRKSFVSD